jgi:ribosomal protein S18 acetylase RimI-like enzyme
MQPLPPDKLLSLALATAYGHSALSLAADGGLDPDVGGAICWHSSSYVPVFNGAGLFEERLFTTQTVRAIESYFAVHSRRYCVVAVDGLVADSATRLQEMGFTEFDAVPAMWLEGSPVRVRWGPPPSQLRIVRVQSPSELETFRRLLSKVFAIPDYEINLVLSGRALEIAPVQHYLAFMGTEPVATASLVLSGPVPGIWNVGTLTEYRRQGIGAELMHHALAEAEALGHTANMLLASSDGVPLYRRLGYETVSMARMYAKRNA